ncbi:3-hydroxyacyl-CoA dehydrogenase NAD-binding domain-containing protein [Caballeronia sp. LjRoot29]|uniref:3-hydroxyacyl-CoA dehydrogenase n=1 Tax=Caballeronia sp. LjRoot29 TaxID=3342315 RepID=UPI003ECE4B82
MNDDALITLDETSPLAYLARAESEAANPTHIDFSIASVVESIAVIGAGTMGSGIAICALDAGLQVTLVEQDAGALDAGRERILKHYERKLNADDVAERARRLVCTTDWQSLTHVDAVIEAVFEDLAVKQEVFQRIDKLARPGALLASNTSYLDLDGIAGATKRPRDVVGLHFFSPAHVMRLMEVVRGTESSQQSLATAFVLAQRFGKLPVLTRNAFGFIGNRVYSAYRAQCEFMLEEGAYPNEVDATLQAFGFAMGPFAVADMSGLDIAWRMRRNRAASCPTDVRYVDIPDRLCEAGRLGRKTGAGYYQYGAGSKHGQPDDMVKAIIDDARARKGIVPHRLSFEDIRKRALLTMVNEAALLLEEGVAARGPDVDVVLANGYGFPRNQGGPIYWAKAMAPETLSRDLAWLAEVSGTGFKPAGRLDLVLGAG